MSSSSDSPTSTSTLLLKRVDRVFDTTTRVWGCEDTKVESFPSVLSGGRATDGYDVWHSVHFVVVRHMPADSSSKEEPAVTIIIKSTQLRDVCKEVIGELPGLSWTVDPLELPVDLFIRTFTRFEKYVQELESKIDRSDDEESTLTAVDALLNYLRGNHGVVISKLMSLLAHQEITWDLLHFILVPDTLFVCIDAATNEHRAFQLKSYTKESDKYLLRYQALDAIGAQRGDDVDPVLQPLTPSKKFGRIEGKWELERFEGIVKIQSLDAHPMAYHDDEPALRAALLDRGRKWVSLYGVHHVHFQGTATYDWTQYEVDARVIVDRDIFRRVNSSYSMPEVVHALEITQAKVAISKADAKPASRHVLNGVPNGVPNGAPHNVPNGKPNGAPNGVHNGVPNGLPNGGPQPGSRKTKHSQDELPEDELILAPAIVYGYSLSDKLWLEMSVSRIRPIEWSSEPFDNLVLPGRRKELLQDLIEAHASELEFDDFVRGKGRGLIISLNGPSGVGKTISAEATAEHLKRPLFVVGGGDLGDDAHGLEVNLKRTFTRAKRWNAVVLIDEADGYVEGRSMHELARNTMVSTFLRLIEYYPGILFLSTSRVHAFDPGFISRVHLAVSFKEMGKDARMQIWKSFLEKLSADSLTASELDSLVNRRVSGRQIKNAIRTAAALAKGRQELMGYTHLMESLDAIEEFQREMTSRAGNLYS